MGRYWENFEEDNRKTLDCLEQTVSRNMNVNNSPSEDSVVRSMVKNRYIILKNTYIVIEIVSRNVNIKGTADKGSGEIGNMS